MVFNNSILLGAGGQGGAVAPFDTTLIGNSIWVDGSGTSGDAMTRTWGSESNQDRWIWATWYQPLREIDATGDRNTIFASGSSSNGFYLRHNSTSSTFNIFCRDNASNEGAINTSESYRDLTAWYHVLVDFDSANAVANDRISLYVNGVRVGTYSGTAIGQNNHLNTNVSGQTARIAQDASTTPNYHMQGYLAQTVFLDNKSIANGDLAITDFLDTYTFGTNGSQRIPKSNTNIIALASAAGTNSFCLDYSDSSNIVDDASTKGNDFTPTGGGSPTITSANQSDHTPSLVYPVVNALRPAISGKTFSEGNLKVSSTSAFGNGNVLTTFPLSTGGKWYWEVIDAAASANQTYGIAKADAEASANGLGNDAKSWAFYNNQYRHSGNVGAVPDSPTNTGTRYMFAVDVDAGKFWMGNDGTWWKPVGGSTAGDPAAGTNPAFTDTDIAEGDTFPAIDLWSSDSATFVFDEDDFAHTIPTGFNYLNSSNLTAPDYQGIDYFDATIYEGNGTGQRVGDFVPFTDVGTISQSLVLNKDDQDRLTISSSVSTTPTNVQKKTISVWLKPWSVRENFIMVGKGSSSDTSERIYSNASGQIQYLTRDGANSNAHVMTTGAFLADTSQWTHVVVALDYTDGSTEADRVKIYANGVRQTDLAATTYPVNNMTNEAFINKASTEQIIGCHPGDTRTIDHSDMYYAEYYMVDGEQLDASVFGQLDTSTNRWVAKSTSTVTSAINALTDGFGNCGFYLDFSNNSDYGEDDSGNNRDWTENGVLDATNQFIDTPSQNFAVIDPVISNGATPVTLSKGNLTGVRSSSGFQQAYSDFSGFRLQENTGIYFAEVLVGSDTSNFHVGVLSGDPPSSTNRYLGQDSNTYGYALDGRKVNDGTYATYGASYTAGDVIGIEIDTDTGSINFHKNGSDQGQAFTAVPGPYNFAFASESGGGPGTFNFGQQMTLGGASTTLNAAAGGRFKHTPPTGAKALNQDNLDDVASKLTAWAWIKNRDATDNHILVDRVRGVGKDLHSNSDPSIGDIAPAEVTNMNTVQRFLQRGVQIGSDAEVNTANESYVLWQWLMGDSATTGTAISADNPPSLASTSLVADAGHLAIISYTGNGSAGATIGHGMSAAPEMVWVKERDNANGWIVSTTDIGFNKVVRLDATAEEGVDGGAFNSTAPTSTLITLGSNSGTNRSGGKMICYAFRSVPGVCKFGTYTGNGDGTGSDTVDGPYVNCGFKPRWILFKWLSGGSLSAEGWVLKDTARQPANPNDDADLIPNGSNAEAAGATHGADILSDGFKLRGGGGAVNKSGAKYLFVAMADIGGNGTLPPIYGR